MAARLPVLFVTDMGPDPALFSADYARALERLGRDLPRPRAIVVMSGHWPARDALKLSSSPRPEIVHDYRGFPAELYARKYPVAGAPELAEQAAALLRAAGRPAKLDADRGLDHGAWAPLTRLYPGADVPVVQLTVPAGRPPEEILAVGRALAPLRERGVLLTASGNLSHDLRQYDWGSRDAAPWAREFEGWLLPRLKSGKTSDLLAYREKAPHAELAAPTTEHFDPLFFALGAGDGGRFVLRHRELSMGAALALAFTLEEEDRPA